jgi:hypothetical protein
LSKVEHVPTFYFSVSKLSHFDFCPKRSKIEIFNHTGKIISGGGAIRTGNRLHYLYSFPNKGFDRLVLKARLNRKSNEFRKEIITDGVRITVIGHYDDLRVLRLVSGISLVPEELKTISKVTSIVELKTTSKKYMWGRELAAARRQLQLYMWLMKEELEKQGFPLWIRSYVEVYSQKTGSLMRRLPVYYDTEIEKWIIHVANCFRGLERVGPPYLRICKFCPRNVKVGCDWYYMMRRAKRVYG